MQNYSYINIEMKIKMQKSILVPVDFTEVTENALIYAMPLAKRLNAGIILLNFVKKDSEVPTSTEKLNALKEKHTTSDLIISVYAEVGGIKDMGDFAKKNNAGLIVMGTHGLKGMQYLVGSKALSVIANSEVPFVVVQELPQKSTFSEIVVPMDFVSEEKVVLGSASKFAKALGARLRIIAARYKDESLSQKVKLNLSFAKRFLKSGDVDYTIDIAPGKQSFEDEIMDFAKTIDADLIGLVNHREDGYKNLFGKNFDQNILTNDLKIPVFIFTARKVSDLRDIFMMFS